jgi:hypothetical protein
MLAAPSPDKNDRRVNPTAFRWLLSKVFSGGESRCESLQDGGFHLSDMDLTSIRTSDAPEVKKVLHVTAKNIEFRRC